MLADADLLAGFQHATLPNDAFHHAEHVRVAWLFVHRFGLPDAIAEFSQTLERFAEAKGKPELYHETITWAFLLLIAERLARQPATSITPWRTSRFDPRHDPGRVSSAFHLRSSAARSICAHLWRSQVRG